MSLKSHLLLLCLCLASALTAQTTYDFSAYDQFLQSEVTDNQIAGAVSLIYKDGQPIHNKTYGFADKEEEVPMTEDQVFHIMSMTKPIVTLAAMLLWEEGHFKLDDPVSQYLDGFTDLTVTKDPATGKDGATVPAEGTITIRQAMTHTAGFSHGLSGTKLDNDFAMAMYYMPQQDIASRVKTMTTFPLVAQPGTKWSYSASPDILALLIEKFSGMTAAEFLQQRLFDPLGMDHTGYNLDAEKAARMAKLYKIVDGKLVRDPYQMGATGNTVFGGTHGLLSTAPDYAKFCLMLLNNGTHNGKQIIKAETLQLMTSNHLGDTPYQPGQGFGLGFGVLLETPDNGIGSKGQHFWSGAYSTFFFVAPEKNMISILMTQRSPYTNKYGEAMWKHVYEAVNAKR
ncbi:MAG: serine hydrolase domain-containing protein [Bacteroidota bacterium]